MKKITYLESDRELEKRVQNLLQGESKGNWALYTKTIVLLVSILTVYSLPFLFSLPLWLLCLLAVVGGIHMAAVGMGIMHDANHGSFSKKQWINSLFSSSLYLVGGYVPNWRMQHNVIHHGYTNITHSDDDLDTHDLIRFSPLQPLKKMHRHQAWYAPFLYSIMTLYWCTLKDFTQAYRYYKEGREKFKNIRFHLFMVTISKIAYHLFWVAVPLLFWKTSWVGTLLFFFCMHLSAGLFLALVFQPAHVSSLTEFPEDMEFKSRQEHQIRTSCNYAVGNKFVTWITGGLNYQIEHHLFPNISHVHYPKIAPIVKKYCEEKNLPYNNVGGFAKAVIEHFGYLSKLGNTQRLSV